MTYFLLVLIVKISLFFQKLKGSGTHCLRIEGFPGTYETYINGFTKNNSIKRIKMSLADFTYKFFSKKSFQYSARIHMVNESIMVNFKS